MAKCVAAVLTTEEINKIRHESIRILDEVGVKISHAGAKKMLAQAGARVDDAIDHVRVPSELTEQCLRKLPRDIVLAGRDQQKDVVVGQSNTKGYPRTCTGCEEYVDLRTGEYRRALMSDVREWAVLVDALDNLYQCTAPYYGDAGLNLNARDVRAFQILLENTTKHILLQPYGPRNLQLCVEMALAERGSAENLRKRPRFSAHISPVPPLYYHGNTVSQLLLCGEYGIPLSLCTAPICGVGGPVTLAGGVVLAVTEHLAAVVMLQLAHPGSPIIFAPRPLPIDMSNGMVLVGSVECALMAVALTQVAKEAFGWAIDVHVAASESHLADAQTALEKSVAATLGSCGGADILSGGGHFESAITLDPAQLVIDNEIFGLVGRAARGIEVNDETLAVDVIKRIGAGPGNSYMSDKHTLRHFKKEYYRPTVLSRVPREVWESQGRKDLYARARERAISLLETQSPPPLDETLVKELRSLSQRAEDEITETTTV